MDIQDIVEIFSDMDAIKIIAVVVTIIGLIIGLAWSQRRMGKMGQNWAEVAQMNGLQFAANPVNYDYGMVVGSRTFDYPGMAGNYRGRSVQVQSNMGTQGGDAGKWLLEAGVTLNNPKPFSAIAYKRGFENLAKERIKKDSKTGNKAIDSSYKIRTEDTNFVNQVFERVAFADWLKQQKFRSGHLMFDGNRLYFLGAVNGGQVSPDQAIALLMALCDLAEAAG
jgi:hypothetical protein